MKQICVLDYGLGNVRSVSNALSAVGARPVVSGDHAEIDRSDALVIPGVGAFSSAMELLHKDRNVESVRRFIASGRPVLGICLGMQVLFERGSEFEPVEGIGSIAGEVTRLPVARSDGRLPHIAWTPVQPAVASDRMFDGIDIGRRVFYFVHSYAAAQVPPEFVAATIHYCGAEIVAAVKKKNVWGTQFHPEKSGPSGLQLLSNFVAQSPD